MMSKIRQGLTLQQSPKHPGLVRRFLHGHQVLNLTEGHQPNSDLIQSSGHTSLKIAKFREYMEPQAGLSGSMRNSNLIHLDLSVSGLLTLSISFTLETKGMGFSRTEGGKVADDMETYSWPSSGLIFFNRSVITVLYVEKKISIYGCHLF
jgi:hypothetical protein